MQGGFTFCGTDIAKLGIYYAPEIENTFVYGNSDLSPHEETFAAHKGGLYYGTTVQPKTFELRCFFEEKNVQQGILDRVLNFFYPGRTGKLIFDTRDWLWYVATVVGVDTSQLTNYLNGFITIRLKAYYPFARTDIYDKDFDGEDLIYYDRNFNELFLADDNIEELVDFLMIDKMPPRVFTDISSPKSAFLYNAGNQPASVAIKFKGNCGENGLTIFNQDTNQEAHFVAFTREATTVANKYVLSDSLNGKTVLTNDSGSDTKMMMLYHDYGFIDLAPSVKAAENVTFAYHNDNKYVESDVELPFDVIGKYIYIDGKWRRIVNFYSDEPHERLIDLITVKSSADTEDPAYIDLIYRYNDPDTDERFIDYIFEYGDKYNRKIIELEEKPTSDGEEVSDVVSMNAISIWIGHNDSQAYLDSIEFIYRHTFR